MSAALKIDLITLFPTMVAGFLEESMIGRASQRGILDIQVHNLRDWAKDKHLTTDDRPFGGGAGMVLKPEPLFDAVEALHSPDCLVIFMTPDGEPLNQSLSRELAGCSRHMIIISGHYEGIDQRVRDTLVEREISIGDFVITNGTLAAAVLIDAVCRHVPKVLGEEKSLTQDSFTGNLLSFPQYTRPAEFRGMSVPEVLLTGNHAAIDQWRKECSLTKTRARRPDLIIKKESEK